MADKTENTDKVSEKKASQSKTVTPPKKAANKEKAAANKPKPSDKPAKAKGGLFSFLIFLIALCALGLAGYIAYEGLKTREQLQTEVSKLQTELSQLRLLDQQPIIQNLMQEITSQEKSQQALEESINQRFLEWQTTLEKKQSLSERKKDDWILNESAYLMRMASTRLYLASDITSAIAALTQADLRIGELENSRYLPIRKKIGDEISALQALKRPDIDGTALRIERLMNNLPALPKTIVQTENTETETIVSEPKSWIAKIMHSIGLKPNAGNIPTQATRDNSIFLDQVIRLELESSKQALIRYKEDAFNNHLKRARSLIKKHYQSSDETVISTLGELDILIDNAIFPQLPDISQSLNLLQSMLNRYKAPEQEEPVTEPASDQQPEQTT